MNPVRVEFIRRQLAVRTNTELLFETDQIRGLKILDVGCGGGLLCESLSRLGAIVTGIDPSAENIAIATRHSQLDPLTSSITYKVATVGTRDIKLISFCFTLSSPQRIFWEVAKCSMQFVLSRFLNLFCGIEQKLSLLQVVEHVDDSKAFVSACVGCVAPEGSLFLSTMSRTRKAYLMTILGAEYVLGLVPTGALIEMVFDCQLNDL
jgi:2-polyprenyl-6-hydroxyphenyl methylase/3-demethylubiquinone-9 3-methyltransferase